MSHDPQFSRAQRLRPMPHWMLALTLVLLTWASAAVAQPRPLTLAMSCAQARGLVASRGSIVLGTGPHTYDRYVLHRGFCYPEQSIRAEWVPTADTPQCFVGYTCQDEDYWFDRW